MLEVCLCKPAIYKSNISGGGKFEFYKSTGGTAKRRGGTKFLKFSGGEAKGRITIFDLNLVGGDLGGDYGL